MKRMKVCDGSYIEWEPVMVDSECDCCGHVTGQYDSAIPDFHGKYVKRDGSRFCNRCGAEMALLDQIIEATYSGYVEQMVKDWDRTAAWLSNLGRLEMKQSEGETFYWPIRIGKP